MTHLALDHWTCRNLSAKMGAMPPTADAWQRLADHVIHRRTELGLSRSQIADTGGPSAATMRLIENALQQTYRPNIIGRLETSLGWRTGSVNTILNGGEPTLVDTVRQPANSVDEDLRRIAANPARSAQLRQWARDQLVQIAAIRAADQAEAEARGEQAS